MIKGFFGFIFAIFLIIIVAWGAIFYFATDTIQENGGIKNTMIQFGKDVKDVVKEIRDHE